MKKTVGIILFASLLIMLVVNNDAVASSFGDDWLYDIAYNAGVQASE